MNKNSIHLENLKIITKELKDLNADIVYLGGSTISLFITDPQHVQIRETLDVDCIVEVAHREEYESIAKKLRKIGFSEDLDSKIICRFKKGDLILDLMPTNPKILGFSNCWYKDGFANSEIVDFFGLEIRVLSLPYLVATKLEAFKGRGKGNYLYSHDIEDIVTLVDGRSTFSLDLKRADPGVLQFIQKEFQNFISDQNFINSLDAHISDRLNLHGRKKIVVERIQNVVNQK